MKGSSWLVKMMIDFLCSHENDIKNLFLYTGEKISCGFEM